MRKVWLLLLLAPSALIYACGGDDSGTDGGSDAANDTTTKPDTGGGDSGGDTSTNDTGTNDTGTNDSGGDGGISITCLEPANCIDGGVADAAYPPDASGVVCCGTITGNGQQTCQITSAATSCKAPSACTTDFTGLTSCSSATVRFCESTAECQEANASPFKDGSKCCTASAGDAGSFKICANSTVAAASGGKIVCN